MDPSACPQRPDSHFGPAVEPCAREFDFTLVFEETVLSVLPSALLILLTPFRILVLSRKRRVVQNSIQRYIKLACITAYLIVQVVTIVFWARLATLKRTKASVPAAILNLVNSLAFAALSYFEHSRSPRPSTLLNIYLILSIILDAARTRTLWLMSYGSSITIPFTVSLGLKVMLLVLEEGNKSDAVFPSEGTYAPEEMAGVFSRTLFWWLSGLMRKGFKDVLTFDKLPLIDRRLCSEGLWTAFSARWEKSSKTGDNALLFTLLGTLRWAVLLPVVPLLCLLALTLSQPLLIKRFLDYLGEPDDGTRHQQNVGYGLIGAYGLVYVGIAVTTAWGQLGVYRFAGMVRGCLVTMIYRKTTQLSTVGLDDASAVTLMSTDVERAVQGFALMHQIWTTLVQIAVALFLLYRLVGLAFIVPLVLFLVCGVAVGPIAGQAGQKQAGWMKAIEKRVGVTSSMLGSMKGVKLSGLSATMLALVHHLRLGEIQSARLYRVMLIIVVLISYIPASISPVITFGAYTVIASNNSGSILDTTKIFTSLSLLSLTTDPLTQLFHALPEVLAAVACVGRIQKFVVSDPRQDKRVVESSGRVGGPSDSSEKASPERDATQADDVVTAIPADDQNAVTITNGRFGWSEDDGPVLEEVNLKFTKHKLTIIVGKVGCGKTTLLKGILGETPIAGGQVQLSSSEIAFCDQTPWMTNQTLQKNITGFSKYDATWYTAVIHACALGPDLAQFAEGDQVVIGSKGTTLSGGQKQRVSIARAVYSKRHIAVFDDVFSGLDSGTQKHVFDCLFGNQGLLRSYGATIILATHSLHLLPLAESIIVLGDGGTVVAQGTFDQLNRQDGCLRRFGLDSEPDGQLPTGKDNANNADEHEESILVNQSGPDVSKAVDDLSRRLGDRSVYAYYYKTVGPRNSVLFLVLLVIWVVMLKFPEIWLNWWGESNEQHPGQDNGKYLGTYTVFQVVGLAAFGLAGSHLLLVIVVQSGQTLHSNLLRTVIHAPMSYFTAVDTGTIINRFSQDIQLIDAELPIAFLNVATNLLVCVSQAIMLLPASYWLVLTYPFLFGSLYIVQKFYLRTSRQLRFLDLEAKSPLYSLFLETLSGLATIRAFHWQDDLIRLSDARLDQSQKPFYLLYAIQRWLNLVLDLMTAALAIIVTGVAVATRGSVRSGFTGVALYNIMTLSSAMKNTVNVWTILETSIGAVVRIKVFEETTPCEHLPGETLDPGEDWPQQGGLVIQDLSARYKEGFAQVLNKVSLEVSPGEKIGICGRSGSGKSSLLLAMLRLLEIESGSITIDGVDLSQVPRNTIRERLNTIPQDPFFLSGTVRTNCDPWSRASTDQEIIDVLEMVQIWDAVQEKGGLDAEMTQDFLSHGQKQLFCMARAVLHPSKIVFMDEATSSVDVETDQTIQRVIRTAFKDATVIAIAHRLDTVLDFDSVIVVDKGVIVEKDNPQQLLARPSVFKALYETYNKPREG